jgi:hypothetical protein
MLRTFASVAALALMTAMAHAQTSETEPPPAPARLRLLVGPQIGVFHPASARARTLFGDNWFNFGIGLGPVVPPKKTGQIDFDLNILASRPRGARAVLAPIGIGYRRSLQPQGANVTYVGVSANALVTSLQSDADGIRRGFRVGYGGSLYSGVTFGQRAYLEARFYQFTKVRGLDLSGAALSAGLRF